MKRQRAHRTFSVATAQRYHVFTGFVTDAIEQFRNAEIVEMADSINVDILTVLHSIMTETCIADRH